MEQEFLKEKAVWVNQLKHGDIAAAAKIAGVQRSAFHTWVFKKSLCRGQIDKRNLTAIKKTIRKKAQTLKQAIAA